MHTSWQNLAPTPPEQCCFSLWGSVLGPAALCNSSQLPHNLWKPPAWQEPWQSYRNNWERWVRLAKPSYDSPSPPPGLELLGRGLLPAPIQWGPATPKGKRKDEMATFYSLHMVSVPPGLTKGTEQTALSSMWPLQSTPSASQPQRLPPTRCQNSHHEKPSALASEMLVSRFLC